MPWFLFPASFAAIAVKKSTRESHNSHHLCNGTTSTREPATCAWICADICRQDGAICSKNSEIVPYQRQIPRLAVSGPRLWLLLLILFMTWQKFEYSIYDLTLKSIPCFSYSSIRLLKALWRAFVSSLIVMFIWNMYFLQFEWHACELARCS